MLLRGMGSISLVFFLPIPPIGVAAYIYVFNLYQHNHGNLPSRLSGTVKEIILSVGVIAGTFAVFVVLLILFINTVRKFY